MNKINVISKYDFEKLKKKGVIRQGCQFGNNSEEGKWSSAFYDARIFEKEKKEDPSNNQSSIYTKMQNAHIGLRITKTKIYIQDRYIAIAKRLK